MKTPLHISYDGTVLIDADNQPVLFCHRGEQKQNAKEICLAVNCRDDMIEALEFMVSGESSLGRQKALAALAKVRGES